MRSSCFKNIYFAFLLFCVFAWILYLNFLIPFLPGDDFLYHFKFLEDGSVGSRVANLNDVIYSQFNHYFVRNGRILSHFFVQLFTLFPHWLFSLLNTLVLFIFVFFFLSLAKGSFLLVKDISIYSLFLITFILFNPEFGETSLWYSGSFNYLWMFLIAFSSLYVFISSLEKFQKLDIFIALKVIFCGLAVGLSSENVAIGVMFFALLKGAKVWYYTKNKNVLFLISLYLLPSVFSYVLMILAPGNMSRLVFVQQEGGGGAPLSFFLFFIGRMLTYIVFYYYGAWLLFLFFLWRLRWKIVNYLISSDFFLYFASMILTNLVMIVARGYYPTRVICIGFVFFLAGIAHLMFVVPDREKRNLILPIRSLVWMFSFLLLVLSFWVTFYYIQISRINSERYDSVLHVHQLSDVVQKVPSIRLFPIWRGPWFFIRDVAPNKSMNYFSNYSFLKFYQVDSFTVVQ